jgi:hypothetical protein
LALGLPDISGAAQTTAKKPAATKKSTTTAKKPAYSAKSARARRARAKAAAAAAALKEAQQPRFKFDDSGALVPDPRAEAAIIYDPVTGKVLWETQLGSPVSGYPVAFAVNGKEYVAVSTGPSLVANSANRLTPEIKTTNDSKMYVFALP